MLYILYIFPVIISFIYLRFAKLTTEIWELSTLAYKLSNILEHLRKQLATCYQYIGLDLNNLCVKLCWICNKKIENCCSNN